MTEKEANLNFETEKTNLSFEFGDEAGKAFRKWAEGHVEDSVILLPHDIERFPNQSLDVIKLDAKPQLEFARLAGEHVMRPEPFNRLVGQLRDLNIAERLLHNINNNVKAPSLVGATVHLRNVFDTPIVQNALAVASEDEEFVKRNYIIANPMIKYLGYEYNGAVFEVSELVRLSGPIIYAPPEAALSYGLSERAMARYMRAFVPIYTEAAEQGSIFHWALSKTRTKDFVNESSGETGKAAEIVDERIAAIVRRKTPEAFGVAINIGDGQPDSRVLPIRHITSNQDVHDLMRGITDATSEITGLNVTYGLPEGAKLA